jgi:hypothetical protein
MAMIDEVIDALARDVLAAMDETGDDRLHDKIAKVLLDASPTTQEIFIKSIRALIAERRAREFLDRALVAARTGGKAPDAPRGSDAGH